MIEDVRSPALKALDALVKERVQEGIKFLRKQYGEDWVEHIDMKELRLADGSACVLGQVHPVYHGADDYDDGYSVACDHFGWNEDDDDLYPARALGFLDDGSAGIEYSKLDEAWLDAIPDEQVRLERLRMAGKLDGGK